MHDELERLKQINWQQTQVIHDMAFRLTHAYKDRDMYKDSIVQLLGQIDRLEERIQELEGEENESESNR